MKRVTGLGGVFFKARNPQQMREWYSKHLGVPNMESYGGTFIWRKKEEPDQLGYTAWSVMDEQTDYYKPSESEFMINYRVADLEGLLRVLSEEGIELVGEVDKQDYGKFGWIMDPDGNKVELWEPVDEVYGGMLPEAQETTGVLGIGGVFMKSSNPKELRAWYKKHLEIPGTKEQGDFFEWGLNDEIQAPARTVWGPMDADTNYYDPSTKQLMINYIVRDLEGLMNRFRAAEIQVVGDIESYDYGKFGWIMDPEGNKIELWQPPF